MDIHDQQDLPRFIEEHWNLTNVVFRETLQSNGGRDVFVIASDQGSFTVKHFHPATSRDRVERYAHAIRFLEKSKFCKTPAVRPLADGSAVTQHEGRCMYLLEFVEGERLTESPTDEYDLGRAAANLHRIDNYDHACLVNVDGEIGRMLGCMAEYPFKAEYDPIIRALPDFSQTRQCFVHTDISPMNALRNKKGEVVLLDLDDAGNGSLFVDLGYPLIVQFVDWAERGRPETIYFKHDPAAAFYAGYRSAAPYSDSEKELIFAGAVFNQLIYVSSMWFGEEAVPFLWQQLEFAVTNKDMLMKALG